MKIRPEILLHPNIPKPMHGLNPRSIFGQEWWDKERQAAYAKTDYHCAACGVHKSEAKYHRWLEAHELYEMDYKNGKMIFKEIVALCHSCHNFIHSGLMEVRVRQGDYTAQKQRDILAHGSKLVCDLPPLVYPVGMADWEDWRLVMDHKEYKGKFASHEEWARHYSRGIVV